MRAALVATDVLVLTAGVPAPALVVDPGGGGEPTQMRPAIDAAADGEEVLE